MNEKLIQDLVEKEWKMFTAVQNIGGPADCQSDRKTFEIMRKSQFEAWPENLLLSYEEDLDAAVAAKRNLLTEKYGYMMENTLPLRYAQIASSLPAVPDEARSIAGRIAKKMADSQAALAEKYPLLVGQGRPVYSNADTAYVTSLETYLKGELFTYSLKTLGLFEEALKDTDIAFLTMQNTVHHYGYPSMDEAEKRLSSRL